MKAWLWPKSRIKCKDEFIWVIKKYLCTFTCSKCAAKYHEPERCFIKKAQKSRAYFKKTSLSDPSKLNPDYAWKILLSLVELLLYGIIFVSCFRMHDGFWAQKNIFVWWIIFASGEGFESRELGKWVTLSKRGYYYAFMWIIAQNLIQIK